MKLFKIISTILYTLVFLFVLLVAGSLVLNRLNTPIKYRLYSVQSGSMEPAIPLGSMIVVAPAADYKAGDVINFYDEADRTKTVTHRIVEISRDEDLGFTSYRTKGDANKSADIELIRSERVVGKVLFALPYLGYPIAFAQTQMGLIALIVIPTTLIVYSEIVNIKNEIKRMVDEKKAKKQLAKQNQEIRVEDDGKIKIVEPKVKTGKKFKKK